MSHKKPLIGITCNSLHNDSFAYDRGLAAKDQDFHLLADDYVRAVHLAGGIPVLIPVLDDQPLMDELLENLDGLLISGGCDVNPQLYGERIHSCGTLDPERDRMEMELARKALELDKPLLAICRGCQILNVTLGGTLYQDLPSENCFEKHFLLVGPCRMATHEVQIQKNSLLSQILTSDNILPVNSFHHSAVHKLADSFVVNAISPDGIIESYSLPDKKFVLAVQWHPEMMADSPKNQEIFHAFIDACR